jgi:cytochrome P450
MWKWIPFARRDPMRFYAQLEAEVGPIVQLAGWPRPIFFTAHPEAVETVFVNQCDTFIKAFGWDAMRPAIGDGMLTSHDAAWRTSRNTAQPHFQRASMPAFQDAMGRLVDALGDRFAARLSGGASVTVPLYDELVTLTQRIISSVLLGFDIGEDRAREVGHALARTLDFAAWQVMSPVGSFWPTPARRQAKRDVALFDDVARDIAANAAEGSVTHAYARAGFSERALRDEIVTLLLAGHETTGSTLAWAFHLLAQNPEVRERIATGVGLGYATQAIQETMRLYPPLYVVGREAKQETTLLGVRIPKRSIVIVSQHTLHTSARYWRDPHAFRPERFDPQTPEPATLNRLIYHPFGRGRRTCIGLHFGMLEMQLVLSRLTRRFVIDCAGEPKPNAKLVLRPDGATPMRLSARLHPHVERPAHAVTDAGPGVRSHGQCPHVVGEQGRADDRREHDDRRLRSA